MIRLQIAINTTPERKRQAVEALLEMLRAYSPVRYFTTRTVAPLPVFTVYLDTHDPAIGGALQDRAFKVIDDLVADLNDEERRGNPVYLERAKDLRRMNGLSRNADLVDNFTIRLEHLQEVPRGGEYTFPEEKELYTEYAFRAQPLVERSIELTRRSCGSAEIPLLVGMFWHASRQLDLVTNLHGYQSFKSHLIGFLSYRHDGMEQYRRAFAEYYRANREAYHRFLEAVERHTDDDELLELLDRWRELFASLYLDLRACRRPIRVSLAKAVRLGIAHQRFRGMSSFHEAAFRRGGPLLGSAEFAAYRMLINFVYLLLPAMGLSASKRVQASYVLVNVIEEQQHDKGTKS